MSSLPFVGVVIVVIIIIIIVIVIVIVVFVFVVVVSGDVFGKELAWIELVECIEKGGGSQVLFGCPNGNITQWERLGRRRRIRRSRRFDEGANNSRSTLSTSLFTLATISTFAVRLANIPVPGCGFASTSTTRMWLLLSKS